MKDLDHSEIQVAHYIHRPRVFRARTGYIISIPEHMIQRFTVFKSL